MARVDVSTDAAVQTPPDAVKKKYLRLSHQK
jgi:hypothetical protein